VVAVKEIKLQIFSTLLARKLHHSADKGHIIGHQNKNEAAFLTGFNST
jgi:hypothetical protein